MSTDARIHLPNDLPHCHEIIRQQQETLGSSTRRIEQLERQLDQLLRARYGRSSEKVDEAQLRLFAQEILDQQAGAVQEPPTPPDVEEEDSQNNAKRKKRGRRTLPKNLERRPCVHDVPPHELACPDCGQERTRFGQDVSEQLEYVPSSLYVVEHIRPKYACKACQGHVITADKPNQPIEKGLPGPGLLAQVVVSKYGDHLPLYRLERIFKRNGLEIPRSTTCGWMGCMAELLSPLYGLMVPLVLESKVVHTDDTPVRVQEKGLGKTRQGRVWVYVGDDHHPYTVFDYTRTHSRDGPTKFLRCFSGFLQADAYPGYDAIFDGLTTTGTIVEVACWAHTRRKFFDARLSDAEGAHRAMAYIGQLYGVEKRAKALDADGRYTLRQAESLPILEQFKRWLDEEADRVLPKSPLGDAMSYTLSNWAALNRYTEDGDLAIDNNPAENALRGLCLGRKNWLFFGSDNGGNTAAVLFSMIASCQRNDVDPYEYLRDVIARISDHPLSQLEDLLPDRWKAARSEAEADATPSLVST